MRLLCDTSYCLLRDEAERATHTAAVVAGQLRAAGWKSGDQPVGLVDVGDELDAFDERLERPLDWERQMDTALRLVDSW